MFISKEKKNSTMFDYSQLKKEGTDRKAMNGMERHINIPNQFKLEHSDKIKMYTSIESRRQIPNSSSNVIV